MSLNKLFLPVILFLFILPYTATGQQQKDMTGKWVPKKDSSSQIPLYNTLLLNITTNEDSVQIIQTWKAGDESTIDTLRLRTGGVVNNVLVDSRIWPTNVFMGVSQVVGSKKKVTARWLNKHQTLKVTEQYDVRSSQGLFPVNSVFIYHLSQDDKTLTLHIRRSTREVSKPIAYVFHHYKEKAYYMKLADNWQLKKGLPHNAFLISLQGIANMSGPNLYFIYPPGWTYKFTPSVMRFYEKKYGYYFKKLQGYIKALKKFRKDVKGYVVWDPSIRASLNVAFTVAGLDTAVVVAPDMVPTIKKFGIPQVANFNNKFEGMSDAEIYKWAYQRYGEQCSRKFIIWMGGVSGNKMQPGIADYGIYKDAFFTDLSTSPKDTTGYNLADSIMNRQEPYSMVMGWHDYAKDSEHTFVTLASSHALRVAGLNTLPNMSFSSQIPTTPGFKFENNDNVVPNKQYIPKKKVYIALIQSDGLGLGAWFDPGRGKIPYAWEVTMNWQWLAPAMLEFFYSQATPNDYFIGGLSGPGYMYPKAIPPKYLPGIIKRADSLMQKLDLNVFEIMDYSQGSTIEGNTNLPKTIVKAYYKYMPNVIGFVNGYAPAQTFYSKNGRPFISFDYYLAPKRSVNDAVADLEELATINSKRPYFLLIHVREWNNIKHVEKILDQLDSEFKVVPLDVFLKMAGNSPTFKNHFMQNE